MLGFKVHSGELELLIPSPGFPCPFQPGSRSGRQGNPTLHVSILFFLLSVAWYSNFLLSVPQLQEMKVKGWCPLPRLLPLHRCSWPGPSDYYPGCRGGSLRGSKSAAEWLAHSCSQCHWDGEGNSRAAGWGLGGGVGVGQRYSVQRTGET